MKNETETIELFTIEPDKLREKRVSDLMTVRIYTLSCPLCSFDLEDDADRQFGESMEEELEADVECPGCGNTVTIERELTISYAVTGQTTVNRVNIFEDVSWMPILGVDRLTVEHAAYTGMALVAIERDGKISVVEAPCIKTDLYGRYLLSTPRGKYYMAVTEKYIASSKGAHNEK